MTIPTITQSQWPEIYIALLTGNEADRALAEKIRPKEGPTRDEIQQKDIAALTMEDYGRMRLAVKRRLSDVESAMTSMGVSAELGGIVKALAPASGSQLTMNILWQDHRDKPGHLTCHVCEDVITPESHVSHVAMHNEQGWTALERKPHPPSGDRIELLTWREHGDDNDSLEVCAFGKDAETTAQEVVAEDQEGTFGVDPGEATEATGKCLIHTGSVTIEDGEVLTTGGRHFRVTLTEVAGMCVKHTDVRCEFDGSGSVTCRKCLAEEKADRAALEAECAERARIELGLKK